MSQEIILKVAIQVEKKVNICWHTETRLLSQYNNNKDFITVIIIWILTGKSYIRISASIAGHKEIVPYQHCAML